MHIYQRHCHRLSFVICHHQSSQGNCQISRRATLVQFHESVYSLCLRSYASERNVSVWYGMASVPLPWFSSWQELIFSLNTCKTHVYARVLMRHKRPNDNWLRYIEYLVMYTNAMYGAKRSILLERKGALKIPVASWIRPGVSVLDSILLQLSITLSCCSRLGHTFPFPNGPGHTNDNHFS